MDNAHTAAFDLALEGAGSLSGGFSLADIHRVEACWSLVDANLASYGFVVTLIDRTRRYLEVTFDDVTDVQAAEFEILDLRGSRLLPEFPGMNWQTDVEHLNQRLSQLKLQ